MEKKEGDKERKIRCIVNGCRKELRRDGLAYHIKTLHKDHQQEVNNRGRKLMVAGQDFEEIGHEGPNDQVKAKVKSKVNVKPGENLNP
jgi:hypothetical protein